DSIIRVCKDWGYEVEERRISVDELVAAAKDGTLEEVWGTGTAAVVSPVNKLRYEDEVMHIGDGGIGELTQKLYDELTGIQWGKRPDTRGWRVTV
ncbi:MAG: branched chain amino acid aminotransferase, partial [Clostridia bacterium]|nr:branched chain amino acid aminotransferase [Clostridia bacterium]